MSSASRPLCGFEELDYSSNDVVFSIVEPRRSVCEIFILSVFVTAVVSAIPLIVLGLLLQPSKTDPHTGALLGVTIPAAVLTFFIMIITLSQNRVAYNVVRRGQSYTQQPHGVNIGKLKSPSTSSPLLPVTSRAPDATYASIYQFEG